MWMCVAACQAQDDLRELDTKVRAAMSQAAHYYHDHVALRGGYVYYYSLDLETRWGEGAASPTQNWVQAPGTPTVGLAYLKAYAATHDTFYLDAATHAAEALLYGQIKSGGWMHSIDYDPNSKETDLYRNGQGKGKNYSTLDDGVSQLALQFLMECDRAHQFQHKKIHEAVQYALDRLLAAQFANGAFPQVWEGPAASQPVLPATFPKYNWRTENRVKEYWNLYTLNDDLASDMAYMLLAGHEIYGDVRCLNALRQLGDFLVLAQLPEPQPIWAQQYNYQMHPCWARKFEPPAAAGHESEDAIRTLMLIYRATGDKKYLEPIPRAIAHLEKLLLPDGQMARFYELETNRPLYMTKAYELTYDDSDLPTHYGFKQEPKVSKLKAEFEATQAGTWTAPQPKSAKSLSKEVSRIVEELDEEGRWVSVVSGGRLTGQPKFKEVREYLSSDEFSENLTKLAAFVSAAHGQ
jgi:PelA/Pel-15E family pectate lyase